LAELLRRKQAIRRCFIFPPYLVNSSPLPGETGNPEITSFHLNAAAVLLGNMKNTTNITWSQLNHIKPL